MGILGIAAFLEMAVSENRLEPFAPRGLGIRGLGIPRVACALSRALHLPDLEAGSVILSMCRGP